MKFNFKKNNKGYALLFTMIILSVVTALAAGISNGFLKNQILASTARESQISFYEADTALECAIYAAEVVGMANINVNNAAGNFKCGLNQDGSTATLYSTMPDPKVKQYNVDPDPNTVGPCFKAFIDKSSTTVSTIQARGYNTCDFTNKKLLERGIVVTY